MKYFIFVVATLAASFLSFQSQARVVEMCNACSDSQMKTKAMTSGNAESVIVFDLQNEKIKQWYVEKENAEGFSFSIAHPQTPDADVKNTFNDAIGAKRNINDIVRSDIVIPNSVLGSVYDLSYDSGARNNVEDYLRNEVGITNHIGLYVAHIGELLGEMFLSNPPGIDTIMVVRVQSGGEVTLALIGSDNAGQLEFEITSAKTPDNKDLPVKKSDFNETYRVTGGEGGSAGSFNEAARSSGVTIILPSGFSSGSSSGATYAVSCSTTSDGQQTCVYQRLT